MHMVYAEGNIPKAKKPPPLRVGGKSRVYEIHYQDVSNNHQHISIKLRSTLLTFGIVLPIH